MTDTTLANIAARAAFSGREESDVTSEPLAEWKQDNKTGKVLQKLIIELRDTRSDRNKRNVYGTLPSIPSSITSESYAL